MKTNDANGIYRRDQDYSSPPTTSPRSTPGAPDPLFQSPPADQIQQSISTACFPCRTRHVKCDRGLPCSRCASSGVQCTYVASRRGINRPRAGETHHPASVAALMLRRGGRDTPSEASVGDDDEDEDARSYMSNGRLDLGPNILQISQLPFNQRAINSFYRHFHPAHPFVLPEEILYVASQGSSIEPLLAAMHWIGALYLNTPAHTRKAMLEEARRLIYDPSATRDAFLLQAMVLLLVGLDGTCANGQARKVLEDTAELVEELSANTESFAILHGCGMPVLEESLRRTWWDLYVVDALIAGVHHATPLVLLDLETDMPLPCEEWQFQLGEIPTPRHIDELDSGGFSQHQAPLSSFAYRITCARNLGRVLRLPPSMSPDGEDLARLETSLTNWRLHLPPSKRDSVGPDGSPDEMMFQAHMMLHATSILLHYPQSQIDSLTTQNVDSCTLGQQAWATSRGTVIRHPAPDDTNQRPTSFNSHARHAVTAACEIGKLITHRTPLRHHTPFFTCVIVLASIVQLNRWGCCRRDQITERPNDTFDDETFLREQVRLGIGALAHISEVWQSAETALSQVRGVAQELFRAKQHRRPQEDEEDEEEEDDDDDDDDNKEPVALSMDDLFGDDPFMPGIGTVNSLLDPGSI